MISCTDLRAESVPAALHDAGKGELAPVERDMLLDPAARTRRLAENFAALPQARVAA